MNTADCPKRYLIIPKDNPKEPRKSVSNERYNEHVQSWSKKKKSSATGSEGRRAAVPQAELTGVGGSAGGLRRNKTCGGLLFFQGTAGGKGQERQRGRRGKRRAKRRWG